MASEQIETLIAAQKEIISATWNIERRAASGAGGRPTDIDGDCRRRRRSSKARAEQMRVAHGTRPRRASRFPQQVVAASSGAPQPAGRRPIRWARRSRR